MLISGHGSIVKEAIRASVMGKRLLDFKVVLHDQNKREAHRIIRKVVSESAAVRLAMIKQHDFQKRHQQAGFASGWKVYPIIKAHE